MIHHKGKTESHDLMLKVMAWDWDEQWNRSIM